MCLITWKRKKIKRKISVCLKLKKIDQNFSLLCFSKCDLTRSKIVIWHFNAEIGLASIRSKALVERIIKDMEVDGAWNKMQCPRYSVAVWSETFSVCYIGGCPDLCAGLYTWLCWTSGDFHGPTHRSCQGPCGWHPLPPVSSLCCSLGVLCKLAEGDVTSTVSVIDEDIE